MKYGQEKDGDRNFVLYEVYIPLLNIYNTYHLMSQLQVISPNCHP
jgi:hypothetical protein